MGGSKPAIVIAGTNSGVGKTSVTVGVLAALRRRGLIVQPFKVGPDFLDPLHHEAATGRKSVNLDGWMLNKQQVLDSFCRHMVSADIAVIEGVMGLYDGRDGNSDDGSTAQIAKWLNVPVVLVVDCWSIARSAAALVKGYREFDPDLKVAGLVLNKVGGEAHTTWLKQAIAPGNEQVAVLGGVPKVANVVLPERHLGLHMPGEAGLPNDYIQTLADVVESSLDLDVLLKLAGTAEVPAHHVTHVPPPLALPAANGGGSPPSSMELPCNTAACAHNRNGCACNVAHSQGSSTSSSGEGSVRIGVATGPAFTFYYEENLTLLRLAGAELVPFDPLECKQLPDRISGLYFGGGYPELHASALSANRALRGAVRAFAEAGGVIYAECGGLMYMSRSVQPDEHGTEYDMVGIFPFRTVMNSGKMHMGYVEVETQSECPIFPPNCKARGQVYHFSEIRQEQRVGGVLNSSRDGDTLSRGWYASYRATMQTPGAEPVLEGYSYRKVLASYVHLHFGSAPEFASRLVDSCRDVDCAAVCDAARAAACSPAKCGSGGSSGGAHSAPTSGRAYLRQPLFPVQSTPNLPATSAAAGNGGANGVRSYAAGLAAGAGQVDVTSVNVQGAERLHDGYPAGPGSVSAPNSGRGSLSRAVSLGATAGGGLPRGSSEDGGFCMSNCTSAFASGDPFASAAASIHGGGTFSLHSGGSLGPMVSHNIRTMGTSSKHSRVSLDDVALYGRQRRAWAETDEATALSVACSGAGGAATTPLFDRFARRSGQAQQAQQHHQYGAQGPGQSYTSVLQQYGNGGSGAASGSSSAPSSPTASLSSGGDDEPMGPPYLQQQRPGSGGSNGYAERCVRADANGGPAQNSWSHLQPAPPLQQQQAGRGLCNGNGAHQSSSTVSMSQLWMPAGGAANGNSAACSKPGSPGRAGSPAAKVQRMRSHSQECLPLSLGGGGTTPLLYPSSHAGPPSHNASYTSLQQLVVPGTMLAGASSGPSLPAGASAASFATAGAFAQVQQQQGPTGGVGVSGLVPTSMPIGADAIVSYSPAATEVLFALGLGNRVAAVTDLCDWPKETSAKPRASRSLVDTATMSSEQVEEAMQAFKRTGRSPFVVDTDLLRAVAPGLVVTAGTCKTCDPDSGAVFQALYDSGVLESAGGRSHMVVMAPFSLSDVMDEILEIGEAAGVSGEAERLVQRLRTRLRAVATAVATAPHRPRVLSLEGLKPLVLGGGWIPEMRRLAGGLDPSQEPGDAPRRLTWDEVRAYAPEVLILAPCGCSTARALADVCDLAAQPGWWALPAVKHGRVYIVDHSLLSRPGPRLVEGIEVLARILHPDHFPQRCPDKTVLKLALAGGQRCRQRLLPNYFLPYS